MIVMCMRDEDVRHRFAADRLEQRIDMTLIQRARIDDRDLATSDDAADRSLERERSAIVRHDPANSRSRLVHLTGSKRQILVERNVGHRSLSRSRGDVAAEQRTQAA